MHPIKVTPCRNRAEQPAEFRVFAYIALSEENAALRIKPRSDQKGSGIKGPVPQFDWVIGHGRCMEINYAIERFTAVLASDVLVDCSQQVAKVFASSWLDSRKDSHAGRRLPTSAAR